MNSNLNLGSFAAAMGIAIVLLICYEYYWHTVKHWPRSYDLESLDHWSEWRDKMDDAGSDDVVIMGSSRAHFDINIHLWDSITGTRPYMLAYPGSSPFHPLADVIEKSDFNGLLVVGVAPGLFYTLGDTWGAGRGKAFVEHRYKRTYAQKLNHAIYKRIDPLLGYTDPTINMEALVDRMPFPNRDSVKNPPAWPPMVRMDKYRNVRMTPFFEQDSVLQQRQKDIWFGPDEPERKNKLADSIDVIMDYYSDIFQKHLDKGGKLAILRPPVSGKYLETEGKLFPREKYWDRLVQSVDAFSFHYADHPATKNMDPPEWSHLDRHDSDVYTRTLIQLLQDQNLLK